MSAKPPVPKPALPSISLAKAAPKEGSAEWLRAVAKEHGSTNPMKLERRRKSLSSCLAIIQRGVKQVQLAKRGILAEAEKKERLIIAEGGPDVGTNVAAHRVVVQGQILALELAICDLEGKFGMIESNCLIFDALTLRMRGRGRSGKKGRFRATAAAFLQDVGWSSLSMQAMLEFLYKKEGGPELAEGDDETEVDDEELVSDDEPEPEGEKSEGEDSDDGAV